MIDCLLVLLIFFMSITSAQVLQIDKDIQLPLAPDAKKKEPNQVQEGALNVKWNPLKQKGTFSFEGRDFDNVDELVSLIQTRKNQIKGYKIIIRGDKNLPAIEIQRTMNVIGTAGVDDISFSAMNQ